MDDLQKEASNLGEVVALKAMLGWALALSTKDGDLLPSAQLEAVASVTRGSFASGMDSLTKSDEVKRHALQAFDSAFTMTGINADALYALVQKMREQDI